MAKIVLVIGILSLLTNISFAAEQKIDKKQIYELQKECGKSAAEFARRWKLCEGVANYQNHYNKKLNVCFIYMTASCVNDKGNKNRFRVESLIDVNENKDFAIYVGDGKLVSDKAAMCYVGIIQCKNLAEFWELIKPYINE